MRDPLPAIAAGHICLDIIPDMSNVTQSGLAESFQPGHLLVVGQPTISTGGPVSNTGLAFHKLGVPVSLMGKIGKDPFGELIKSIVRSFGASLGEGLVQAGDVATSYTVSLSPPGVDRIFIHHPGANDHFGLEDINMGLVQDSALFHFGYPPIMDRMYRDQGKELIDLFRAVKQTGATTSLDMCFPDPASQGGKVDWHQILIDCLPFVDIFLPSVEELLYMIDLPLYRKLAAGGNLMDQIQPDLIVNLGNRLLEMGARIVVIKLGDRGLYLQTASASRLSGMGKACPMDVNQWANCRLWAPCFKVKVSGTTGSGDATIAGFLTGLLRDLDPVSAVTMAVAVGACNVEASDALSGIRSWEATSARIQAGWERIPIPLSDSGWSWLPREHVWSYA
jgi:sugar/nucleoside kinase (ribokinase family)